VGGITLGAMIDVASWAYSCVSSYPPKNSVNYL
jgi:hypothetical protein